MLLLIRCVLTANNCFLLVSCHLDCRVQEKRQGDRDEESDDHPSQSAHDSSTVAADIFILQHPNSDWDEAGGERVHHHRLVELQVPHRQRGTQVAKEEAAHLQEEVTSLKASMYSTYYVCIFGLINDSSYTLREGLME